MNMRSIVGFIGITGLGLGFALGGGCLEQRAADHCANKDGDADCARRYPDGDRPYCVIGTCEMENLDGCYATRPGDDACYSPCGDGKSLEEDPDCEGVAEGSSTSVSASDATTQPSTSEPTGEVTTDATSASSSVSLTGSESETETEASSGTNTTSSGCTEDAECSDAAAPICFEMACVPCTEAALPDAACAEKDPGLPACREDGQCVACTPANPSACEGTTPVCNADTSACEGCDFHEQCEATACDIATGACFEDGCVVEVDGDGGGADYTDIQDAIADGCVVVVHEAAGGYPESVVIDAGMLVALLAAEGEEPLVLGVGGNGLPAFDISGGAVVYMRGLSVNGNDAGGIGVDVSGASVWLDQTSVVGNTGGGIALVASADGHLRNCFVGGNGNEAPTSRGLDVANSALDILYTTVARNDAGIEDSLACDGGSDVTARNSIFVGRDSPSIACAGLTATHSAFDEAIAGEGNENVGAINNGWFVDVFTNDFHLTGAGEAIFGDVAQWQLGDPPVDIDGDLRPTDDGTADVAGADIP